MRTTIAIAVLFAVARIWVGLNFTPEPFHWLQAYKDAAHLFMGGLAVAWWLQRFRWQWWTFWALNVIEVAVAVRANAKADRSQQRLCSKT